MASILAVFLIAAVLTAGTKSGRSFAREARKAAGWRTPRAALRHRSGRAGALAGRGIAGTSRVLRGGAAALGRRTAGPGRDGAAGWLRTRRGPLLPLMWRGDQAADPGPEQHAPDPEASGAHEPGVVLPAERTPGAGHNPLAGPRLRFTPDQVRQIKLQVCKYHAADNVQPDEVTVGQDGTVTIDRRRRHPGTRPVTWRLSDGSLVEDTAPPVPQPPAILKPEVCAACGNPEYGPKRNGGNWGPLVTYREPVYDDGYPEEPRLIHKEHFEDESDGFYGRPYDHAPPSGGTRNRPPSAVSPRAARSAPQRRTGMTRYMINLEPPSTDGEFLESCTHIAGVLKGLADDIGNWADGLSSLNLPQSVLNPLHQIADGITDAARGASQGAKAFEDEFEDARDVASRGMTITGQDAA